MILQRYLELVHLSEVCRLGTLLPTPDGRRYGQRRRFMQLGNAFTSNITSFTGAKTNHNIAGTATGTPAVTGGSAPSADMTRQIARSFTYSTGGANTINQFCQFIFTAVKNTTTSLDLTGALVDFLTGAAATFSKIREIWFENLTTAQDATNGSASTATLTVKFGASNPWIGGPWSTDGKIYLAPGAKQFYQDNSTAGWTVTAGTGDKLDFVHGVNDADSKVLVSVWGEA